jgi:hypothetical protein
MSFADPASRRLQCVEVSPSCSIFRHFSVLSPGHHHHETFGCSMCSRICFPSLALPTLLFRSFATAVPFVERHGAHQSTLTSLRYDGYLLRTIPKNNIASN